MSTKQELIRLLYVMGYGMYTANLNGTPHGIRMHQWHSSPSIGDLVIEVSSLLREDERKSIGTLVRVAWEPIRTDEEWDKDEHPTEKVHYIKKLWDGEECRWVNASFVRLPQSLQDIWQAKEAVAEAM